MAIALTRHTTPAQRAESHAAAARMLEEGAPVERYAAAVEYAAAGRRERALSLAKDTAEQALAEGDAALASEAARLAAHTATAKEDRFTLGWLEARAYLAGGRVAQAVDLLHLLDGTAPSHSDRLATGLALAHCYAQRGLLTEARSTLARIGRDLNPDDHIVRLQLAVQLAHNTLLHPGTDCSRSERTQVKLEAALSEAAVHADCFPVIWVDCFRTLLAARATEFSARSARDTLARFSSVLIRLDNPAQSYHQLALAALELRAGNLRVAQSILDRFSPSSGASNRLHILALHNLGVVALESGRFAAALKLFESCRAHDEQHGISPSERSATLINEAQCHLYLGNDRAANELCHAVRSSIDGSCSPQSNAQAIAIQSIVCSRRGQRSEARDLVNELQHIPSRCFAGDDGYLTAWAVLDLVGSDRETVATVFDEADRLETIHPIGAAKLRIIAGRHQPDRRHETAVALASRTLRGAGMGWFERTVFNWDCSRQPG